MLWAEKFHFLETRAVEKIAVAQNSRRSTPAVRVDADSSQPRQMGQDECELRDQNSATGIGQIGI